MTDHDNPNNGQSPLRGVVLCCTSIPQEQRSEMAVVAQQMGAVHKLDLTSDVTHLIVGIIDTPKYKYVAKERQDIKVLLPAWLDAVRESWIAGEETDVAALEEQYTLPTFFNLKICVTGFDNVEQRDAIQQIVEDNGATYHKDLTKSVTHLIAATPSGKKYEYAGAWLLKIVGLEWLNASLERGMALDDVLFHPRLSPEDRGKGAVTQNKNAPSHLGKHPRADLPSAGSASGAPRKLRRTASTRLESQNDDLWADIGSVESRQSSAGAQERSLARSLGTENKKAADEILPLEANASRQIFRASSAPVKVFVHGFDHRKTELLYNYLEDHGAEITSEALMKERLAAIEKGEHYALGDTMIVVPHDSGTRTREELCEEAIIHRDDIVVSEWWVEKCLHKKRLIDHQNEPFCKPFQTFPITGFSKLTICPTSFTGIDLLQFSKAVKLLGASYDEVLRKETSVLVCQEARANPGTKLRYALENSVPVVSSEWLYDCVKLGKLRPFEDYSLSTATQPSNSSQWPFFHPEHNPRHTANLKSSRSSKDPSDVRPSKHRGCLDLTRVLRPEETKMAAPSYESQEAGQTFERGSPRTRNDTPQPLHTLSPSKQNSQHTNSVNPADDAANLLNREAESHRNSPQLRARDHAAQNTNAPDRPATPSATQKQHANNLNTAIASLLAQQQQKSAAAAVAAARPSSASSSSSIPLPPHTAQDAAARSKRTLGRALSSGSAMPMAAASSGGGPIADDDELNATESSGGGGGGGGERAGFRPSQALSYEDPEGAAVREQLMARLNAGSASFSGGRDGAREESMGRRVQSIGVARDLDERRTRAMRRKGA